MKLFVSDPLWALIEPLLPRHRPSRRGGRPRVPDRAVLSGIVFVLRTGIPWEYLPPEMGCGSGITCWRRLREWQRRGVWQRLHQVLLQQLASADQLDWSRAIVDSRSLPAKKGGALPARIRRIKANRARSTILFRTGTASRSRSR